MDPPKEFRRLKREVEAFKKFLRNYEVPSREEEVKKAYLAKLRSLQVFPREGADGGELSAAGVFLTQAATVSTAAVIPSSTPPTNSLSRPSPRRFDTATEESVRVLISP